VKRAFAGWLIFAVIGTLAAFDTEAGGLSSDPTMVGINASTSTDTPRRRTSPMVGDATLLDDRFDNFNNWTLGGTHVECYDNWHNRDMYVSTDYDGAQWSGNPIAEAVGCARARGDAASIFRDMGRYVKRFAERLISVVLGEPNVDDPVPGDGPGAAYLISGFMNTAGFGQITVDFKRYVHANFGAGDHLKLEVRRVDGAWDTITAWTGGQGDDTRWHSESFVLTNLAYFHSRFQVRFSYQQEKQTDDSAGVDDLLVTGRGSPPAAVCGNSVLEPGEVCDLGQLGGAGCQSLNFDDGTLACLHTCERYDTSGCTYSVSLIDDTFDDFTRWTLGGTRVECYDNWHNRDMYASAGYDVAKWSGNPIAEARGCPYYGEAHLISQVMDTSRYGGITIDFKRYVHSQVASGNHLKLEAKTSSGSWVAVATWAKGKGDDSRWRGESFTLKNRDFFHGAFQIRFNYRGQHETNDYASVDDLKVFAEYSDVAPFRVMAVGDAHMTSDIKFGRQSLLEAIRHSEYGGPQGAPPFAWDIMVNLGDLVGGQRPPTDAEAPVVLEQLSWSTRHPRETIYNVAGNHDASGPGEETQWWFKKYIDPTGENTAFSGVDDSRRPYPVHGTWERYSFQVGNILFLMMSDRNDGGPPVGRGSVGGYPAGAVSTDTFEWWKKMVEDNKDKIIVTGHHHVLKDTTVGSGFNEGMQITTMPDGRRRRYHGRYTDGAPEGSSYLYFVGDTPDAGLFENYLEENPGAVSLWLGGHTHTYPDDKGPGGEFSYKSHIEQKWGVTFINASALTLHHGKRRPYFPLSRLLTFFPGEAKVRIQSYLHTSHYSSPGWYAPAERTVPLQHPFSWDAQ
jgi:hypothetical protein